jgi:hypothetical protein
MSGRIAKYSDEAYQAILTDLAAGVPLSQAIGGENRPGRTMFYRRVAENPEFAKEYDRCLVMRAQARIAKIEDVIDQVLTGHAEPAAAKVALDALRFLASKEDSRRYGDVSRQEISGRDGTPLIPESPKISDFELARKIAWILGKAERAAEDRGDLVALESAP